MATVKYLLLVLLIVYNIAWAYFAVGITGVIIALIGWLVALLITIGPLGKAFEQNIVNPLCGRTCKAKK